MARPSPLDSFVWGAGGEALTPEQIARQREIAATLGQHGIDTSPVASWTQGAARVANALAGVLKERRADKAEGSNATANSSILQSLLQGGTSGFPAAPSGGAFPAAPAASGGGQAASAVSAPQGVADGIRQTAAALGIDPVDLGTAISYETAGTFDPTKKGPTTQWGQHEGLIQFGEPQRKQFGVDLSTPEMAITSQLGPDGAVAKYLRSTGVKPGMGLLDVYSAINAGGVGKYDASDANNGGAPGTVRDKVEKQMAEHRAKALALLGGDQAAPAAGAVDALAQGQPIPTQVASADPSIGVAQALASPVPMQPGPLASDPAHTAMIDRMTAPQSMTGGAPMAMQDAQLPPQFQQPVSDPQQQVAQAQDMSQLPVMAGGSADAIPAGQAQQGINPAIIEALSNPAASEQTRKIAGMLLGQQMQSQDPANQLDMKYKQAQIDALGAKAPKEWVKLDDDTLFNAATGETKQIGAGGPPKFAGTGLDAQAWNILQTADPTSREYATAYSIVSQPKTQLVQTENGMMPVEVPPNLPAWLQAPGGGPAAPPGASAAPPGAAAAPSAAQAVPGANVIPGTKKPQTEMQARNGAIGKILLNEVPTLGANFQALADPKGQLISATLGKYGNPWQSEEYQRAAGAVQTSISNVLYSLSGASSNPGEVVKQIEVLTPQIGDKPGVIADKLQRFKTYVRAISSESNDPELQKSVEEALSKMDSGGAKKTVIDGFTIEEMP